MIYGSENTRWFVAKAKWSLTDVLLAEEFDIFWKRYPRRVAKLSAMKAFQKARETASLAEVIAGVDIYIQTKPDYADYCFPATWLNQGRWMDEAPAKKAGPMAAGRTCPHTPICRSWTTCTTRILEEGRAEK